jgi:hypothetical protein
MMVLCEGVDSVPRGDQVTRHVHDDGQLLGLIVMSH